MSHAREYIDDDAFLTWISSCLRRLVLISSRILRGAGEAIKAFELITQGPTQEDKDERHLIHALTGLVLLMLVSRSA